MLTATHWPSDQCISLSRSKPSLELRCCLVISTFNTHYTKRKPLLILLLALSRVSGAGPVRRRRRCHGSGSGWCGIATSLGRPGRVVCQVRLRGLPGLVWFGGVEAMRTKDSTPRKQVDHFFEVLFGRRTGTGERGRGNRGTAGELKQC